MNTCKLLLKMFSPERCDISTAIPDTGHVARACGFTGRMYIKGICYPIGVSATLDLMGFNSLTGEKKHVDCFTSKGIWD